MKHLTDILWDSAPFQRLRALLRSEESASAPTDLTGVYGAAHAYLLATLARILPKEVLLFCLFPTQTEARRIYHDLFAFGAEGVGFFPLVPDILGEGSADSHKSLRAERIEALDMLRRGGIVVTSVHAAAQRLPHRNPADSDALAFSVGKEMDYHELIAHLGHTGYRRVDSVELKGEFAVRGGMVDVFPLTSHHPYRIEFFGDEIESVRLFDETTQRSIESMEAARILPVREFALTDEARQAWLTNTGLLYVEQPSYKFRTNIDSLTEQLFETGTLPDVETYYPFLFPNGPTLASLLPDSTLVYASEPTWMRREMVRFMEKLERVAEDAKAENQLWVDAHQAFASLDELRTQLAPFRMIRVAASTARAQAEAKETLLHSPVNGGNGDTSDASKNETLSLGTQPFIEHKGSLQKFLTGVEHWHDEGYHIAIFSETAKAKDQMEDILRDHRLLTPSVSLHAGWLSEGFCSEGLKLVVIPQEAIFGQSRLPHRQSKFRDGRPLLSLLDLQEGDFIVHVTHGIGKYLGIKRLKVQNEEHDFLVIQYAGSDILYVPTYNINLVQKYIGTHGEKGPALEKLGGGSWAKAKARVKASVEVLAKELLALYAQRQATPGFPFSSDSPWQKEFEAAFPYEETPDQLRAIEDVKNDMETARPMDRLICGDVGYGKTEVAIRAAFKAVMDGKQVAVLVPTTVLAQQHYYTFRDRFREFPAQVRLLSRFASAKDVAATLEMVKKGTADVIIGTHRLLSKDVEFRDLGLLIIDEEHRFGVKHKERLKQLRKQVDVVTMTATPIPRTLHMAMSGVRDLSVINTPPENRLPIETYVMEYRPEVVREAVLRELSRGGQVYFVHNRVESIESIAQNVRTLVPEARVQVGHGQMTERELEDVMMRFIQHQFDVLVCTTIIESGLDIPNCNTILVNRADALGLAQLYQLRGRVGRSDRRAYGYMFYSDDRSMSEHAQKRLRVIEEFTELGSGFKIALRDMEIRGAGNLLGPEQHGHIASIGYDLYCKLLENAVAELKGELVEEEVEARISLPVSAYLPDEYVSDASSKMTLYKRMARIRDESDRDALEEEMRDRYGDLPDPVRHLLNVALVKAKATCLGISSIAVSDGLAQLSFDETRARVEPEAVLELLRKEKGVRLIPPSRLAVTLPSKEPPILFATLIRILNGLKTDNSNRR